METKNVGKKKTLKLLTFKPQKKEDGETSRQFMKRMKKILPLDEIDEIMVVAFTTKGGSSYSNRLGSDTRIWMLNHAIRQILQADLTP